LSGYSFGSTMMPRSAKAPYDGAPERPRFVVIWMTPFAAAVP
jgi:hypothetical protein